jgi:hypothetical protein
MATLSPFELPDNPNVVDPTLLKPTMQEVAPTSTIDAAIVTSPYVMQQLEPATCTKLNANCIPISSPPPQHPSNDFGSPMFGQQLKTIETPLRRDQLERARKNREIALKRLVAKPERNIESASAVSIVNAQPMPVIQPPLSTQAGCSPISEEQRKRAEENREMALRKRRASLATTSTEISQQPLRAYDLLAVPRNVRAKLEMPFGVHAT